MSLGDWVSEIFGRFLPNDLCSVEHRSLNPNLGDWGYCVYRTYICDSGGFENGNLKRVHGLRNFARTSWMPGFRGCRGILTDVGQDPVQVVLLHRAYGVAAGGGQLRLLPSCTPKLQPEQLC